jgi:hypothetical protein
MKWSCSESISSPVANTNSQWMHDDRVVRENVSHGMGSFVILNGLFKGGESSNRLVTRSEGSSKLLTEGINPSEKSFLD